MYITIEEFQGLVAAVVDIGQRLEKIEEVKRNELEERIYTSLPTSVQAAMIDEEFAAAEAEMEEILK